MALVLSPASPEEPTLLHSIYRLPLLTPKGLHAMAGSCLRARLRVHRPRLAASAQTQRVSYWPARMERTQGPDGSFKSDNRLVGPLARWAILCAHNDLRGRIEVRGEPDQAWHKAEGSRPLSPYPWLDTASPFTPMGSYGVVAPAPFSGTVAEAASAMIDPNDTDALFPAPGAR